MVRARIDVRLATVSEGVTGFRSRCYPDSRRNRPLIVNAISLPILFVQLIERDLCPFDVSEL